MNAPSTQVTSPNRIEPNPAEAEAARRYRPSTRPDDDEMELVLADREAFVTGIGWTIAHLHRKRAELMRAVSERIDANVRLLVLASGTTLDQFETQFPGIRDALAAQATDALVARTALVAPPAHRVSPEATR